ncbi:MAG: dTDP-4-dehydrorhamnose 3,5-epimerase, partial [Pseudomonadota bacterium]
PRFADARGYLSVTFDKSALMASGIDADFVQDNQSLSRTAGTVRGLHFQTPPAAQPKLLRVLQGSVFDVAVDIRRGSATYGHHVAAELSAENGRQIWIPAGFAHGFMTLEQDTIVHYKMGAPYSPEHEAGLLWNDPGLGIDWPLPIEQAVTSDRDREWPTFSDYDSPFDLEGVAP